MTRRDNEAQRIIREKVHSEGYEGIHSQMVIETEEDIAMAAKIAEVDKMQRKEDFFMNVFKAVVIITAILLWFTLVH